MIVPIGLIIKKNSSTSITHLHAMSSSGYFLKCCFQILLLAPKYSMEIQARLPVTLASIHNFIQIHDSDEAQTVELDNANEHGGVGTGGPDGLDCEDGVEADGGLHEAQIFCDNITELM